MKRMDIELNNEAGLHARPACMFVEEAAKHSSKVMLYKNGKEYNGKSLLSILSMGARKGEKITIAADGADEGAVIEALKVLIENGFKE